MKCKLIRVVFTVMVILGVMQLCVVSAGYPKLANYLCGMACDDTAVPPSGVDEKPLDNWDLLIMIMDNQAYGPAAAAMQSWRQAHPAMEILAYLDPLEFNLNALTLETDASGEINRLEYDLLQEIILNYPEWWLLEPGSTLSEDINASQTEIFVDDIAAFTRYARNAGEEDNPDPTAPNYIMVNSEHMLITGINTGNSSLTVQRNLPDLPAATSHVTGSRIAAHVVYWEGTWMMNCSDLCPDVGGDQWNTFLPGWLNERLLETAPGPAIWTGIYLDCIWWDMTWLATGCQFVDLDNDGAGEIADGFNELWQDGLRTMVESVKVSIPAAKHLMINGDPEIETRVFAQHCNGLLLEQFPNKWTWGEYMPAYMYWDAGAVSPVMNVIDCSFFDNPSANEKENYPLMRLGLTSCLMGNGYFGYDDGDWGHDKHWWYDEYDNAGAGRGYLGQPTGEAESVSNCMRRRFENGIVVCNPTTTEQSVDLGGTYRKINGNQDPVHNDGSTVTRVTVPPKDGYVLLLGAAPEIEFFLEVSQAIFMPGDEFYLWAEVEKPAGQSLTFDEYIVLDVLGQYFFWPGWVQLPDMDHQTVTMGAADTLLEQDILEFIWPDCSGSITGLWFYGLLFEPGGFDVIISNVTSAEFGFSCD